MPNAMVAQEDDLQTRWFVMRDLKRANALMPAYRMLGESDMEVFTPMRWRLTVRKGRRIREEVPFMQDLLFVHSTRAALDPVVERVPTLQYRWLRKTYRQPMTVADNEMERFIGAVTASESPRYYLPEEVTPQMCGRRIRIVGGPLDGYVGSLVTTRGSKVKRLLVNLPGLLAVSVEVNPEYIRLLEG